MKHTKKDQSAEKVILPDKKKNSSVERSSVKNQIGVAEYEEDRSMKIRMKPQPLKSAPKNTSHEDNKDE